VRAHTFAANSSQPSKPVRFSVDGWDTGYGPAVEFEDLAESHAQVDTTIEVSAAQWAPVPPTRPDTESKDLLFADGVRRIDARVWIDDTAASQSPTADLAVAGICASYAAGVVCCCGEGAHALGIEVRRGLFTAAATGSHIDMGADRYVFHRVMPAPDLPIAVSLTNALQRALTELEIAAAVHVRALVSNHGVDEHNLLVVDGPLRGRAHLPRTVGYVKTHHAQYLPTALNAVVAALTPGERTPIFVIGTGWERYSWYLRLPCMPAGPWAGIVRLEAAPTLDLPEAVTLAAASQNLLGRFASVEYKEARAPQNLVPIAGLEKELRHRLGDASLLYRDIRAAAMRNDTRMAAVGALPARSARLGDSVR